MKESFQSIDSWREEVQKYAGIPEHDIKLCVIGNKDDLSEKREIATETGKVSIIL